MRKNIHYLFSFTLALIICISGFSGFSQKVKYKNLFPILQSKDYITAEPLLIAYLKDTKDEANPYFYLGEILSGKLDSTVIFPTSGTYDSIADVAISAYKNAISLVNDKEVRKNDEYYMAYNRRDLRTGKFGIKISDIHLDYEEKINFITKRKAAVAKIHLQKKETDSIATSLNKNISELKYKFQDEQSFYFRSTKEDYQHIKLINSEYVALKKSIEDYISLVKSLNNSLYNPELQEKPVVNWNELSVQKIDLESPAISLLAVDGLLDKKLNLVQDEIMPLKDLLIKTDQYLNNIILIHQNISDSSEIKTDTIPSLLKKKLEQAGANLLPLKILEFKQMKAEASLLSNEQLYPVLKDSANVYQRTNILSRYKLKLEEMLEMISSIRKATNDKVVKDYSFYFSELKPSFEGYFETEQAIIKKNLDDVTLQSSQLEAASQSFIYMNDTIYLNKDIAELRQSENSVQSISEKEDALIIAGTLSDAPFVAIAGFNMQVKQLFKLDSSANFHRIIKVEDNYLLIVKGEKTEIVPQTLVLLSPSIEKQWSYKFTASTLAHSAKVEAGIFFIYDEDGAVLKTLNSSGKEIGG
ncbi:hypothetical protein GCM10011506_42740 [Marivirga lumbricoides]|uniref:Uncharacterized protein n=1 Tax=Marivirga lumbricoides TaxID=1046115 RepID=A0ABQ1N6I5_9BACT|nr:hypothetical protein GCM10011506_42740 [Marivirga lumbricoides]